MPFDNTNFVETAPQNAEEIAILDKMAEILATPERWHQGGLLRFGDDSKPVAFCVIGAMHASVHRTEDAWKLLEQEWTPVTAKVHRAMVVSDHSVVQFNDDPATTHQDILDLIARTRASFS